MEQEKSTTQQQASEYVKGDRGAVYGSPLVNHQRIADIWSVILGTKVTPEQAVLCMLGVKLARLVQTVDHKDTIVDIHGYCDVLEAVNEAQKPLDLKKAMQDTIGAFAGFQDAIGTPGRGIRLIDPRGKVFYCETATAASILVGNGWTQADPDEPTAFTAPYPDGSKDMTFEEACGVSRAAAELDLPCEVGTPPSVNDYYSALEGWTPIKSERGTILGFTKAKKEGNPCGQ